MMRRELNHVDQEAGNNYRDGDRDRDRQRQPERKKIPKLPQIDCGHVTAQ